MTNNQLPKFTSYGNYSNSNYGAHSLCFTTPGGDRFWFSYNTLVAFQRPHSRLYCHENNWGTTTGKHLNWIEPDHKARLTAEAFQAAFELEFGKEASND